MRDLHRQPSQGGLNDDRRIINFPSILLDRTVYCDRHGGFSKGREGFSYFIGSLLFSPLVVGVVALGVPPKPDQVMPSEGVKQGSMREGVLALTALTMVVGVGAVMAFLRQGAV